MPRRNASVLTVMLVVGITTSACTTLGYVPEHFTFHDLRDTVTYVPTYKEVKKWAYDVADGYDSRAIINRQALYAAQLLAGAAIGTIAGLGAFDPGSSAIAGIPIGTTFLASVAYIYSSEEKARIYRLGSEYIKDLIAWSDERLAKRRLAAQQVATALVEAKKALNEACERLNEAEQEEKNQKDLASSARADAEKETDHPRKVARSNLADAAEKLAILAKDTVAEATLARDAAQERFDEATRRYEAWRALVNAERQLAEAKRRTDSGRDAAIREADLNVTAAERAWKEITGAEPAEALCLRKDINEVMRTVEGLKAQLDPKDVVAKLRAVQEAAAKIEKKRTSDKEKIEAGELKTRTPDLKDLTPPVKSHCANAI